MNQIVAYKTVEESTVRCLLRARDIKMASPSIKRVDLYARVLKTESISVNEYAGTLMFQLYLQQKVSNGFVRVLVKLVIFTAKAFVV